MAEEEKTESASPKKKGKLPILIALVAVLGGGGFFAMKMKGGGEKHKVELGEIVKLEEILVNLKEPNTYARTDISLQLQKGFEKKKLEDKVDAVRDAIILRLSSKSLREVNTLEGKLELKREIASAINAMISGDAHSASKSTGTEEPKAESDKKETKKPSNPDWDSDTGPVLKVYFANFATQ